MLDSSPTNTARNQKLPCEQGYSAMLHCFGKWNDKVFSMDLHVPKVTDSKAPTRYFLKH